MSKNIIQTKNQANTLGLFSTSQNKPTNNLFSLTSNNPFMSAQSKPSTLFDTTHKGKNNIFGSSKPQIQNLTKDTNNQEQQKKPFNQNLNTDSLFSKAQSPNFLNKNAENRQLAASSQKSSQIHNFGNLFSSNNPGKPNIFASGNSFIPNTLNSDSSKSRQIKTELGFKLDSATTQDKKQVDNKNSSGLFGTSNLFNIKKNELQTINKPPQQPIERTEEPTYLQPKPHHIQSQFTLQSKSLQQQLQSLLTLLKSLSPIQMNSTRNSLNLLRIQQFETKIFEVKQKNKMLKDKEQKLQAQVKQLTYRLQDNLKSSQNMKNIIFPNIMSMYLPNNQRKLIIYPHSHVDTNIIGQAMSKLFVQIKSEYQNGAEKIEKTFENYYNKTVRKASLEEQKERLIKENHEQLKQLNKYKSNLRKGKRNDLSKIIDHNKNLTIQKQKNSIETDHEHLIHQLKLKLSDLKQQSKKYKNQYQTLKKKYESMKSKIKYERAGKSSIIMTSSIFMSGIRE